MTVGGVTTHHNFGQGAGMTADASVASHRPSSPWIAVVRVVLLLTVLLTVLLTAFVWPAVRTTVHDVPIAVAGPATAVEPVRAALAQRMPGAFDIVAAPDTAAAERLIREREVYGAVDLSGGRREVITASAASPTVAQVLQGVAAALNQADPGRPVVVRDLVPLPADDPRGVGLSAGALPLVIAGLLAAVALTRLVRGTAARITGAVAFAVTGGLAMAAVLQFWLGSLDGPYHANAGAIALTVAATSLTLLGLESLFGFVGLGVGAVVMMLVGNPLSGAASAPELLPGWSGRLGQLLPPGAGGQLLRSTAFFEGNGAAYPATVLAIWLLAGVVLSLLGRLRARRTAKKAV